MCFPERILPGQVAESDVRNSLLHKGERVFGMDRRAYRSNKAMAEIFFEKSH